jgi:tryptophan-rich sensory protein
MSLLMRLVDALNQDDGLARRLNIGLAIVFGLLVNGLALLIQWNMAPTGMPWFALPAWIGAIVWLCLFALLGASRWMLNSYTIIGVATARTMVTLLLFTCLLWPFYSLPVVDLRIALFGNAATLALAIVTIAVVRRRSVEAASLVMPLVVWLAFSTLVVISAIGLL